MMFFFKQQQQKTTLKTDREMGFVVYIWKKKDKQQLSLYYLW